MKKHSRIVLVFLPTKAPELNLIEVRWMWMQSMAINNNIFENESDIGEVLIGPRIIIKLIVIQPLIFYTRYSSLCKHSC